jgi:3-oxoacyl-[acyl-carrier protein] reductase
MKRVFDINYFNQILFSQYLVKKMVRAKSGSIINIASTAGLLADAGTLTYGGSKAALIHATKVMATELGPFGIRVNAIAPAVVETDMAALMDEKARSALDERSAIKGTVETEDVAELISFLASARSTKITGQIVRLDRGLF